MHDTSTAGWSTTPYVKATVKNYGSKAVKLDFEANIDLWAKFFADGGNPFNNLSTVTLEGMVMNLCSNSEMMLNLNGIMTCLMQRRLMLL